MDEAMESALRFYEENRVGSFGRHAHFHFMQAMKLGYATMAPEGSIAELPGSKTIEYSHERWRVVDTYIVTPNSPYSGGTTMLYYDPLPVFMMQYLGKYEEIAIPCLKAALKAGSSAGEFNGGRGQDLFVHEGFTYTNDAYGDFFTHSSAFEQIFDPNRQRVGWHRCQSIWMLRK